MKLKLQPSLNIDLRQTTLADLKPVKDIIQNVLLSEENDENAGFLINFPEEKEYVHRISNNMYNIAALINSKLVGVLINFSSEEIIENTKSGFLLYESLIFNFLFQKSSKFLWLDQIAIHPKKFRRKGVASKLIEESIEIGTQKGYQDFFLSISIFPERNIPSINLVKKIGFSFVHTVIIDKRVWAIFHYQSTCNE